MTQTDGHFMSLQTIILLQIVLLDIKEALILCLVCPDSRGKLRGETPVR